MYCGLFSHGQAPSVPYEYIIYTNIDQKMGGLVFRVLEQL